MTSALAPALVTTQWARVLMDGLASKGVTDAVVSPGSRSTPLAAAALADERITCRWVIDERSAGFVALGMSRLGLGTPLLICTSGTAGAHYLPALLEAEHAGLPLVVVTADRPPELQRCGANQTLDQRALYGGFTTWDLGLPCASERSLRALRRTASQAGHAALRPRPRPIHLNAPFRKPLEPAGPLVPEERAFVARVDALLESSTTRFVDGAAPPSPEAIHRVQAMVRAAKRGLIVAGPGSPRQGGSAETVASLARRTGFAVYAETTSSLRRASMGALLALRARDAVAYDPDFILQIGGAPVASEWLRHLDAHDISRAVFTDVRHPDGGWADPHGTADEIVIADLDEALLALLERLPDVEHPPAPQPRPAPSESFDEVAAAGAAVGGMIEGSTLMVGNSLSARVLDEGSAVLPDDVEVLSQRGVSGIDGLVAGAVGAAVRGKRPTLLLLGDVSLTHDLGSLQLRPMLEDTPLTVVVLDNRGGRIFDRLPLANTALTDAQRVFWRTPPDVDFEAVAGAHRWSVGSAHGADDLAAAVRASLRRAGGTLLRAVIS